MPDTPDTGTAQAQTQGQPVVTPTNAQVASATQGNGSGPWSNALAQFDDTVRPQVDALIRSEIQPYITRQEQQAAELRQKAKLWDDLESTPAETYLQITQELFGDEAVDSVIALLTKEEETPDVNVTTQRDPEVEALINESKESKRRAKYDADLASLTETHKDSDIPVDQRLIHTFIHMTDGDMEAAYEGYKQYMTELREAAGIVKAPVETAAAPNALGSDTASTTTPPVQKTYSSIDEAFNDFFKEQRASAPPVVGAA